MYCSCTVWISCFFYFCFRICHVSDHLGIRDYQALSTRQMKPFYVFRRWFIHEFSSIYRITVLHCKTRQFFFLQKNSLQMLSRRLRSAQSCKCTSETLIKIALPTRDKRNLIGNCSCQNPFFTMLYYRSGFHRFNELGIKNNKKSEVDRLEVPLLTFFLCFC